MVELRGFKVNSLEVENRAVPGTELKLQNQVKYNVNYMDGEKKCIGLLELRVLDADHQPFNVKIDTVAEFACGEADEKPEIHTASFDQLFPFIREIIHNVTGYTGMPGLLIPIIKLNKDTVKVGGPSGENSPLTSASLSAAFVSIATLAFLIAVLSAELAALLAAAFFALTLTLFFADLMFGIFFTPLIS